MIGPTVRLSVSCAGCDFLMVETGQTCIGDTAFPMPLCKHELVGSRYLDNRPGTPPDQTPAWCPERARAIAEFRE